MASQEPEEGNVHDNLPHDYHFVVVALCILYESSCKLVSKKFMKLKALFINLLWPYSTSYTVCMGC